MSLIKNSYCSYCGTVFDNGLFPKICKSCQNTTWINPIPIVIAILPILKNNKFGVLIQQRGINPQKGHWALPSGYIELGETVEQAVAREVKEEMVIDTRPDMYRPFSVLNSTDGNILIFLEYQNYLVFNPGSFKPNEEVLAVDILYEPTQLAFPSHTKTMENYFDSL